MVLRFQSSPKPPHFSSLLSSFKIGKRIGKEYSKSHRNILFEDSRVTHFGITSLNLHHFRNIEYIHLKIEDPQEPVVLISPNGSGKTNILEAISLFSPGRGLRSAHLKDIKNTISQKLWQAGLHITLIDGEETHFGMGLVEGFDGKERKLSKKETNALKSHDEISSDFNVVWVTPLMDRLVSESGQFQRQFIDRLIFTKDPKHASRRLLYDKMLRERNAYLKTYKVNEFNDWLDKIEDQLALTGAALYQSRHTILLELNKQQAQSPFFPHFTARMADDHFDPVDISNNQMCYEQLKEGLKERRDNDSKRGITSLGPHRSYLHVFHKNKAIDAEFCSTGEQKMLLLAIILAFVKTVDNQGLILLLDDVVDHLDETHKTALLHEVYAMHHHKNIQCFMTGNAVESFAALPKGNFILNLQTQMDF